MKNNHKDQWYEIMETPYLSASDIVNQGGHQYVIREPEMESAIKEIMRDIDGTVEKKNR